MSYIPLCPILTPASMVWTASIALSACVYAADADRLSSAQGDAASWSTLITGAMDHLRVRLSEAIKLLIGCVDEAIY